MSTPVIVVADDDAEAFPEIDRELRDRYARHYRIAGASDLDEAHRLLETLAATGDEVALVLSGQRELGDPCVRVLEAARRWHPGAKRGLLIAWGDWGRRSVGTTIFESMARGLIDTYLVRPAAAPDEAFHQEVSGLLLGWAEDRAAGPYTVHIVGESWSGRAYELRNTLGRCALPHSFTLAGSDRGKELLAGAGDGHRLPVVLFPDGKVLDDPTDADIARAAGSAVNPGRSEYDLVIVGAGPAGLSAAVYGSSEGLSTLVVDEGGVGGQAGSSSMIRNYLGFPRGVSGRRLAQRAFDQAWIFGAKFSFMQRAAGLRRDGDRLVLTLSDGDQVRSRAVLLAMGADYRRVGVPALEALNGAGVYYGGSTSEAPGMAGCQVFVLGGANSAGQAALHLARWAAQVTLVVRAGSLADGMSHYLVRQVEQTPNIRVRTRTTITGGGGAGTLEFLVLSDGDGRRETVPADGLFLMIGAHPQAGWLPPDIATDEQGFLRTGPAATADPRWPLDRPAYLLETTMPGVFAAGDVRGGSVKRVASAVGAGGIVIQLLHEMFAADARDRAAT